MYKEDLALNNQQWLICHKTKLNQTVFSFSFWIYFFFPYMVNRWIEGIFVKRIFLQFFPWSQTLNYLELVYRKFISVTKNNHFDVIQNAVKSDWCKLEQRSLVKFVPAENWKTCEIYRRMCDIWGEERLTKIMFTHRLNIGFPWRA